MAIRPWSRRQILYVIIMHILIMSSSLAAFLFIRLNKITLEIDQNIWAAVLLFLYINAVCIGPQAPDEPRSSISGFFFVECASHILGLGLLVFLLNIISPILALCVGILSSMWFIALCFVSDWLCVTKEDLQEDESGQ